MTFVSFTSPNGNRVRIAPEAVEYVRPTAANEQWPKGAATVIGMASGQLVVVMETELTVLSLLGGV